MKSTPQTASEKILSINYRENFAQFLTESERSAYTIKNYLCDLDGFAQWLKSKGNKEFSPTLITPTDLREYKHYLDEILELKPQTINRKLSSLRSFLNWAGIKGFTHSSQRLWRTLTNPNQSTSRNSGLSRFSQTEFI